MTNKKINLNTDFLDENDETMKKEAFDEIFSEFFWWWKSKKTNHSTSTNDSSNKDTKKTYGFKHVFWGLVILVVVIALFGWFDDKSKSANTTNNFPWKIDLSIKDTKKTKNSNEDEVIIWQFSCSSYNYDEAWRLSPNSLKKAELDRQLAELNLMDTWIDKIEAEIDSFKLNENSQSSINTYNKKINTYNSLVNKRKVKYTEYKNLLDSYNASVDKYNSFLEKNCTRRY